MNTDYQKIRIAIEQTLVRGGKNFIIYPFGEYGTITKKILNESFGIQEKYIVDNNLSKYNLNIMNLDFFKGKNVSDYTVLLTNANPHNYEEIRNNLKIFDSSNVVDIFPRCKNETEQWTTKCGKYSYGPLCHNRWVEEVGAFSSFAQGTDALENHPTQYVSTHPFIYTDKNCHDNFEEYNAYKEHKWYFPGVLPKGRVHKMRRIRIGNDVWLGKNVLITNGAYIGNGVIAAAGAVITKDVPDYAVVAGIPARIIRYRYTSMQIRELNKIAWWSWTDEKIRECYNDFFIDINEFIDKHKK